MRSIVLASLLLAISRCALILSHYNPSVREQGTIWLAVGVVSLSVAALAIGRFLHEFARAAAPTFPAAWPVFAFSFAAQCSGPILLLVQATSSLGQAVPPIATGVNLFVNAGLLTLLLVLARAGVPGPHGGPLLWVVAVVVCLYMVRGVAQLASDALGAPVVLESPLAVTAVISIHVGPIMAFLDGWLAAVVRFARESRLRAA